jgi:putative Holliday junction resolvase
LTTGKSGPGQPRPPQTYLGFDYGSRRIGVAVGQTLTGTARDLDTVKVKESTPDWARISELVNTWQPAALVVGLPLNSRGEETGMSRCARIFGRTLADRYSLTVHWVNEYLTSESARQLLPIKKAGNYLDKKDQIAALLILESFLNEQLSANRNNPG